MHVRNQDTKPKPHKSLRDFFVRYKWIIAALLVTRLGMVIYVYPDVDRLYNGDSWLYEQYGLSLLETGEYLSPGYGKWIGYDRDGVSVSETLFGYDPFADMIRPPGLPAVIALVYGIFGSTTGLWVLSTLSALMSVLSLWLITRLLGLFRSDHGDWLLWIFVVDPAWILYSKEILTEPFFVPLMLGGLYLGCMGVCRLYERWKCGLYPSTTGFTTYPPILLIGIAGLLFGIATLFKPIMLYVPLAGSIFLSITMLLYAFEGNRFERAKVSSHRTGVLAGLKSGVLAVIVFFMSASVLIWAWQYRNYVQHGSFVFTSIQAENLMTGHAAFVLAQSEGLTHTQAQDSIRILYNLRHPDHGSYNFRHMSQAKQEIASEILHSKKGLYMWSILRGMAITMMDPGRLVVTRTFETHGMSVDEKTDLASSSSKPGDRSIGLTDIVARDGVIGAVKTLFQTQPQLTLFMLIHMIYLGVLFILAMVGMIAFLKKYPLPAALITCLFVYLWVLGGPSGYARFRLYLLPIMLVYIAFVPVGGYLRHITSRRDRSVVQT